MAKNIGVVQFTGKMGEVVGQKSAYGSNVLRKRVFNIKNPETAGQATQRMKTTPAQNFYRALAEILDHAFQGVKYGAPSYSYFLKKAMSMTSGFPYLVKGDKTPWPGKYVIAEGGLQTIPVNPGYEYAPGLLECGYTSNGDFNSDDQATVGEFSHDFIEKFAAQAGDQVTIVICIKSDFTERPIYNIGRIILDPQSTVALNDLASLGLIKVGALEGAPGFYAEGNSLRGDCIGGAVILSRPPRNAGGQWQRSNTVFALSEAYEQWLADNMPFEESKASYMKKSTIAASPYYLNGGDLPANIVTIGLAVDPAAGGTVTGGGQYPAGERVTLTATPATGYTFTGWFDSESGDELSTAPTWLFEASRSMQIEAKFAHE